MLPPSWGTWISASVPAPSGEHALPITSLWAIIHFLRFGYSEQVLDDCGSSYARKIKAFVHEHSGLYGATNLYPSIHNAHSSATEGFSHSLNFSSALSALHKWTRISHKLPHSFYS